MRRALFLGAVLFLTAAAARPSPPPSYTAYSAEEAIANWMRLCVATMPDRGAFAAALAAEPGWVRFQKREGRHPVLGLFWRSPRGELSYQDTPFPLDTNPGCHYTFRTMPAFSHDDAARALAAALGLTGGRSEGTARAPQTRWEGALPNGTRVRVFLSSAARGLDTPAARLSISAYRAAPPRR